MKNWFKKALAVALSAAMTMSVGASALSVSAQADDTGRTVLDAFLNPNSTEKPMCRMWFPDGWAGVDEYDTVAKQINALAEAGFGGIEIAYLADGSNYSNADAAKYSWGTEAWKETMKKVLRAANSIEGGFTVDITFTSHWPLCINTIDPNDDAASSSLTASYTKVTGDQLTLALPDHMKTADALKNPFIFVDKLTGAELAKVTAVDEKGNISVDLDSVIDITGKVQETEEGGWAAGIPDEATFNAMKDSYGWSGTYESAVVEVFGADPVDFDANNPENISSKIDKDFNRARMADYQYQYEADLSGMLEGYTASEGDEIAVGDYVAIGNFYRGTGQVFSDGGFGGYSETMINNVYVPDYINSDGIKVITDYWEQYILDDEMLSLMEQNAATADPMLFEDSLELTGGTLWTSGILEDVKNAFGDDYAYTAQLMAAMAVKSFASSSGGGWGQPTVTTAAPISIESEDSALSSQLQSDYSTLKNYLYSTEHYGAVSEWSREHCAGYGFRVQIEADICATVQENVDVIEGDNGTKGDGLRARTAFKNLMGKDILSMEAVTGMTNCSLNWADVLIEVGQNYSQGVNHVILHGTPYSKSLNGYNAQWPGWCAFGNSFADSYSYRQAYWDEANALTGYMSRTQAVLHQGTDKKDLAVFGQGWSTLLNNGWTYDIVSDTMLTNADHAAVSVNEAGETVLYADGPEYRAVVVSGVSTLTADCLRTLTGYAEAGLPIYLVNTDITSVNGTEKGENTVANVTALFAQLKACGTVKEVSDKNDALLSQLAADGIAPAASYDNVSNLVTTHYADSVDGSDYYYLYNDYNSNANQGMVMAGTGANLKTGSSIDAVVTLTGTGTPYVLDAITGEITPVASYTDNGDGTITMAVSLQPRESMIVGITTSDNDALPEAQEIHALCDDSSDTSYACENGQVILQSAKAGEYVVEFSDGSAQVVTVAEDAGEIDLSDGWDLTIQSYGPDKSASNIQDVVTSEIDGKDRVIYYDPSQPLITEAAFSGLDLTAQTSLWKNLPATKAQLAQLGVEDMKYVSGVGLYTKTFTLDNWDGTQGAVLNLSYSQDEVTKVTVNGTDLVFSNLTDDADISAYLQAGENTIVVKTATTLLNRAMVENEAFDGSQKHAGPPASLQTYGLTGASISLYQNAVAYEDLEVISAGAETEDVTVGTPFAVTVVTSGSVQDVQLYNEYDMKVSTGTVSKTSNEDGTITYILNPSLGTVGDGRTLKVVVRGSAGYYAASGKTVTVNVKSVAPVLSSFDLPETAVANRTFIVQATTDMAATKINVYNEFGAKMGIKSLTYKVVDGQKVWTGVMAIGTKGDRTFTAYAVNKYGVQSDALTDSIRVKAFA